MSTTTTTTANSNSNSNAKASKRNAKAKAHKEAHKEAHNSHKEAHKEASNVATPTLPDTMPARCVASYSAEKPMDAQTAAIFRYHLQQALLAISGAEKLEKASATICQIYNFLRGDNPLRLEKDGSPKQDGLPRWGGLGSSKLFRNFTSGTYLEYTNKVCANGRMRSVAVAGPLLQEAK